VGLALVFAVLPFMGMLAKPLAGWLADRLHLQKTVFMASILLSGKYRYSIFSIKTCQCQHKVCLSVLSTTRYGTKNNQSVFHSFRPSRVKSLK
jgi:nitrate/nitrite transporter NarK